MNLHKFDPEVKAGSLLRTTGYSIFFQPGVLGVVLSVAPCRTYVWAMLNGRAHTIRLGPHSCERVS